MDVDAIEIDFGDGCVVVLRSGIDVGDGEANTDGLGARFSAFLSVPADFSHVEILIGIDVVEMQRGELLTVDGDLQILDTAVLLPGLTGAVIAVADDDRGDAGIAGGELILDPFADAIARLAFHPCGLVAEVGGIDCVVVALSLRGEGRRGKDGVVFAAAIEAAATADDVVDVGKGVVVFGCFELFLRDFARLIFLEHLLVVRLTVVELLDGLGGEVVEFAFGSKQVLVDRRGDGTGVLGLE